MLISLRKAVVVFFVCTFTMLAVTAESATLTATNEDQEAVEWQLSAQKVSTLNDAEVIEAEGDVVLRQGKDYLKADFARYYAATNWVYLSGNVEVFMNNDNLSAENAEFDLGKKTGWLKNGKVFMAGPHVYFTGERIQKNWGDSYTFNNAKITVCDGERPAWSLETSNATLELEGYAVIHGADVEIKDVPVFGVPYFVLPVKTRRESGFLRPDFGSTTRLGFWVTEPYYWAIDQERDMTFYPQYMSKRGFMPGIEYRSRTSSENQLWVRADWINDAKTVDTIAESKDFGYDGLLRTNENRYWVRGMFNGELPDPKWKFKADIDYASDQDLLREFNPMTAGFDDSQGALESRFGRSLNSISDPIRTSRAILTRDWNRFGTALVGEYNQNSKLGHGNQKHSTDTTLQRLPEFDAYLFKNRIPGLEQVPFTLATDFQSVLFARREGTDGNRTDIMPMLGLPMVTSYGTITPEVGMQQVWYNTNRDPLPGATGDDSRDSRTLFKFGVSGYTELARVYNYEPTLVATKENVGETELLGIKHAVQPRFEYRHVSGSNLSDTPYYDYVDRLGNEDELTVSLVNILTKKQAVVLAGNEEKGIDPSLKALYGELLWFRMLQSYDFEEAKRDEDKLIEKKKYERRPWSDLEGELRFYPWKYVSFSSRTFFSYYDHQINRHDHTLTLTAPKYGVFSTGVDFRSNLDKNKDFAGTGLTDLNVWKNSLTVDFFAPIKLAAYYEYDFEKKETYEQSYSLIYDHQCFRLIFKAKFTPFDDSYKVYLELPGLTF
ncbi:LPS-assembly protein LptD [Halodesulfovibrio marinisediminis]|uniref:LPS-assembly protein n=1 Tax=Halodesulfovibrio marinisediminis DSM 17456 TaxID=1121457 RepID=A0A1N6IIY3_9BACT|nr:LPS assembly protein LptD [Halodesulfovibrio marinisediminis]SIO31982.1 LPS-assembly protein [Halodesulfovibrio marinisediminis DSM 17456]